MIVSKLVGCLLTALLALPAASARAQRAPQLAAAWPQAHVLEVLNRPLLETRSFLGLVRAGRAAVPGLLLAIGNKDEWGDPLALRQRRALRALRLIGNDAADAAMPVLFQRLGLGDLRSDCQLLDTMAALAGGLADRPAFAAEMRLVKLPPAGLLLQLEEEPTTAEKACLWSRVLRYLDHDPSGTVPKLVEQLGDTEPLVRERAARLLGGMCATAVQALPALIVVEGKWQGPRFVNNFDSLAADYQVLVRDAAAIAIARIDATRVEARRGLTLLLARADDPRERAAAAIALAALPRVWHDPEAGSGVDDIAALLAATWMSEDSVVGAAVVALGQLAPARKDVRARLEALAESDDRGIAARARATLRSCGGK